VTLATALVAARADAEGSRYFQDLSERNPADATAQALAGFFEVRAGRDSSSMSDSVASAPEEAAQRADLGASGECNVARYLLHPDSPTAVRGTQ
jgi:hypothetical protein